MKSVLLAYASKYRSTIEIIFRISDRLNEKGLITDVRSVEVVHSLHDYDAVIVGGAVYVGNWTKPGTSFLKKWAHELAIRDVWLFSSGPVGKGDPIELLKGWILPEALKDTVKIIRPHDITLFHGKVDYKSLKFIERIALKTMGVPEGDFRDWQMIDRWADDIAEMLLTKPAYEMN